MTSSPSHSPAIPAQLLAFVGFQAAAQHQLSIPIRAGLCGVDKTAAGGGAAVAGQLLVATEPAQTRPAVSSPCAAVPQRTHAQFIVSGQAVLTAQSVVHK